MSDQNVKKPETKEELVNVLTEAAKKSIEERATSRAKPTKPTLLGTAEALNIHRDTLYTWLKEFNVDFKEITDNLPANLMSDQMEESKHAYLIGEALIGEGNEVAHIDLLIGDKEGPVGDAFAAGMSNMSAGHTPLLAVIRPNLPPKPHTLLVPKVTTKNLEDVSKIFGPAQAAVAKGVADAVEEGIIPREKIDDWVIIASVFVHPQATDFRKIYQYNYGATKLALRRAIAKYPPLEKILYDKDRAKHPIMGFKVPRLWRPPYLQIAIDNPDLERAKRLIAELPGSDRIILEVGTPLIKRYGARVINDLRQVAKDFFFVADLKTLDVGKVEVDLAYDETADAVVASGLAPGETIDAFVHEAKRLGIYAVVDMMNVDDPLKKLKSCQRIPRNNNPAQGHRSRNRKGTRTEHYSRDQTDLQGQEIPYRSRRRNSPRNRKRGIGERRRHSHRRQIRYTVEGCRTFCKRLPRSNAADG